MQLEKHRSRLMRSRSVIRKSTKTCLHSTFILQNDVSSWWGSPLFIHFIVKNQKSTNSEKITPDLYKRFNSFYFTSIDKLYSWNKERIRNALSFHFCYLQEYFSHLVFLVYETLTCTSTPPENRAANLIFLWQVHPRVLQTRKLEKKMWLVCMFS